MHISYHAKQTLRRVFSIVAVAVAMVVTVVAISGIWLQRFIVYTDDGIVLNFDRSHDGEAQLPQSDQLPSVTVEVSDTAFQEHLPQLTGYYISDADLRSSPSNVLKKLKRLPAGTQVMLDIKNYRGYFYYTTYVGNHTSSLYNISQMNELINWISSSDLYFIARMPAFRDWASVNENKTLGLTTTSGALYTTANLEELGENLGADYWLDPSNNKVQNYLIDILNELKNKGFDEVVLTDFCFPNTDDLSFSGDQQSALTQCANLLVNSCAGNGFAISFSGSDPGFILPEGRCRLYLENISAEDAPYAWEEANVADKRRYLVFVVETDNESYHIQNGVLRPLT